MATPKRILVVDDDADFQASVVAMLEDEGYEVILAKSGQEGLERARKERPDLIVLDIMMEHEWAGYEINQAVKFGSDEQVRSIPVLMVSSIPDDPASLFSRSADAGMITPDSYLTKPLDIREFLRRVRRLTGRG